MFERLGRLMYRRRWPVLALTGAFVLVAVVWGTGVFGSLNNGGFEVPDSESSRASEQITQAIGRENADVLVLFESERYTVGNGAFRKAVDRRVGELPRTKVSKIVTYRSVPELVSKDRHATYAVLTLAGATDDERRANYDAIEPKLREPVPGFDIKLGGDTAIFADIDVQTKRDVERAEMISFPAVLILLVIVFGGLVAAAMPLVVGGLAILGSFTVLWLLSMVTDISIFSLNIVTMIGLGLAIDYALFVVTRFREQLARGDDVEQAIVRTMATAGRTVAFSGITVALAIATLTIFPVMFLRSMAFGGTAAVAMAMLAALTVLPAMLAVLGHRVNRLRIPVRRRKRPAVAPESRGAWYRVARTVMRRPVLYVLVIVPVLLLLGAPFLHAKFGGVDETFLPAGTESRTVAEKLDRDFARGGGSTLHLAVTFDGPATSVAAGAQLTTYLSELDSIEGVDGTRVAGVDGQVAVVNAQVGYGAQSLDARAVLTQARDLPTPPGTQVMIGGETARIADLLDTLRDKLPLMGLLIVLVTFVLLFMAFGSVVLPIKAIVINVLSLTASFGALVWIFQDGHLASWLGFTSSGYLEASQPVLLFAVAFGLSMDYELFLLSRIREEYDRTGDNNRAVAAGVQRTGRIITSAALVLGVVLAAFSTSGIVLVKMIGIGLVLALVLDATVVRTLLVPATMRLMGRLNWWAPGPLARFWVRHGIRECDDHGSGVEDTRPAWVVPAGAEATVRLAFPAPMPAATPAPGESTKRFDRPGELEGPHAAAAGVFRGVLTASRS